MMESCPHIRGLESVKNEAMLSPRMWSCVDCGTTESVWVSGVLFLVTLVIVDKWMLEMCLYYKIRYLKVFESHRISFDLLTCIQLFTSTTWVEHYVINILYIKICSVV